MTKNDDPKMASFKIGDLRRPEVRGGGRDGDGGSDDPPADDSVGFPSVESRLESGDIESVAEELRPSYEALEDMASSGDMRKKGAAKRAMAAYERTADLFEYLFETKSALQPK